MMMMTPSKRRTVSSPPRSRGAAYSSSSSSPLLLPRVSICIPWYKVGIALLLLQVAALLVLHSKLQEAEHNNHGSSNNPLLLSPFEQAVEYRFFSIPRFWAAPPRKVLSTGKAVESDYRHKLQTMEDSLEVLLLAARHNTNETAALSAINDTSNTIRSCRYSTATGVYTVTQDCPPGKPVTYYNSLLSNERIVCGHVIPPQSSLELAQQCNEPARLWKVIPDTTGRDMAPVTVRFASRYNRDNKKATTPGRPFKKCDIPCHHAGRPSLVASRIVDGTDWQFIFSMEGPKYYRSLEIKPDAYKTHQYYSTTSYKSEVPLPYFSWVEYQIQQPAVDYDQAIPAAVFLARNCKSINNREGIVKSLQNSTFRVDSLSSCLHNAPVPAGLDLKNKTNVMQHYLFYLAFENQNVDDYITEKLWGPFESGTVPVYFGAPNIHEHVPPHSIIAVSDFDSIDALAAHLAKVASDKALYESYHEWRTKPLPRSFHRKYDFTEVHSTCRTCRWAYAKLYGLGWNHENQSLTALSVDRTACVDATGRIVKPFREAWSEADDGSTRKPLFQADNGVTKECPLQSRSVAFVENGQLRRTVWAQDGVLDMLLENMGLTTKLVLNLETTLKSVTWKSTVDAATWETVVPGHGRLQNDRTRITVLTWPTVPMKAVGAGGGTITVEVDEPSLPLRLRVIIEDIDTVHQGADEVENHFGQVMIDDFFSPIEAFVDMS